MSQVENIVNTFGEVIHDHQGTYQTIYSGEIKESEINQFILKDTSVGESDDENLIVDLGLTNGCRYIWTNYCSKNSVSTVAMGRSHAAYMECTLETLQDTEVLVFYPYATMNESQNLLRNRSELQNADRNKHLLNQAKEKLEQEMQTGISLPRELLYHMICYALKQKSTGFRNFLYISVPDSVEDYQGYCKSIIVQFLRAIPAGLRKQLRFATNAASDKENNYHILFCRESVLNDSEKQKKSVQISSEIPQFLLNHGLDEKMSAFIRRCVEGAFDSAKENVVQRCFEKMERRVGDVNQLKERDYRDYYEITKLGEASITTDVLKGYSEKLGQALAEKQRQMLNAQINLVIAGNKTLESTLKQDSDIVDTLTMNQFFDAMASYKNLIKYLKTQNVELSKEFYTWKLDQIKAEFWAKRCPDKDNAETKTLMVYEEEWNNALNETNSVWKEYFKQEYAEESIENSLTEQADLQETFKKEQIAAWKVEVTKAFSTEKLKEICQRIQDTYPEEIEEFCKYIYDVLVATMKKKEQMDSLIKSSIKVLRQYNTQASVPEELYGAYVTETMKGLLENPERNHIETEANMIGEIYGEGNKSAFVSSLRTNLTKLLRDTLEEKTVLSQKSCEDISDLMVCINTLGDTDSSDEEVALFESAANACMTAAIMDDLKNDNIEKYYHQADMYLVGAKAKQECKDKIEEAYVCWNNQKKRQERQKQIQENTRFFEAYFYSWKNEEDLMMDLETDKLRRQIYDKNVSKKKKKIHEGYTLGAFLAAVSYTEGVDIETLLCNESLEKKFYVDEFKKFMEIGTLPILIKKQDTVSQIFHQLECYARLCGKCMEDVTFICYESSDKIHKIEVGYNVASRVLDTLIKVKNHIPAESEQETERRNMSASEKEFWKFLYRCGMLGVSDCEKLISYAEKTGMKDLAVLSEKAVSKKKRKKLMTKVSRGIILAAILVLFVVVFFVGRASNQAADTSLQSEATSNFRTEVPEPEEDETENNISKDSLEDNIEDEVENVVS